MALLLASFQAAAQTMVDVPAEGYMGTDTLPANDPARYYIVTVPAGHVLEFDFHVVGEGNITVSLSKMSDPNNYYVSFSTSEPVRDFSRTFPEDYGFDREFFIQVYSTAGIDVDYTAEIHTEEAPEQNYTLHYVLMALGLVGLAVFSYKYVVWQEKQEKKEKQGKRRERRRR